MNLKNPKPVNASIAIGTIRASRDSASGQATGVGASANLNIRSGRQRGVVVMYGVRASSANARLRLGDTGTHEYIVIAFRGRGPTAAKSGNEISIESVERAGKRAALTQNETCCKEVVGPNRKPTGGAAAQLARMANVNMRIIGGGLGSGSGAAARKYILRNVLAEAFNRNNRAGRAAFLNRLAACCTAQ